MLNHYSKLLVRADSSVFVIIFLNIFLSPLANLSVFLCSDSPCQLLDA